MRGRLTGFVLALILLAAAVPATLGCCLGPPPGGGPHALSQHAHSPRAGYTAFAAARTLDSIAARDSIATQDGHSAVRDCADHPAPAQTPYIETNAGGGGRGTVTSRGLHAATDASISSPAAAGVAAHRYGVAADDSGPPLWLRTCVSRT